MFEESVCIADPIINDPEVDVCLKFSEISKGAVKLEGTEVTDIGTLGNDLFQIPKFYLFNNPCTSESSLKNNIKTYIKITLKQLRHVSVLQLHHHQGAH